MLSPQVSDQVPLRLSVLQICILSPGIWSVNPELMLENYHKVHKFLLHLTENCEGIEEDSLHPVF